MSALAAAVRVEERGGGSAGSGVRGPVITGWSAVSPYGIGREAFVEGAWAGRATVSAVDGEQWPGGADELACLVPGFSPREVLGKKGTRSMDRVTGLAVATVRELLREERGQDGPYTADEGAALVLGTTTGSAQSMMDLTRDTFVNEAPFYIDPSQFPNTVMNCAAGQCAIWYGLKGPNTTVAAGRASGLLALNYARRLLASQRATTVLCGAVEEYSAARSWLEWHTRRPDEGATVLGEGCAVLRLEPHETADRPALAELVAVTPAVVGPQGVADSLAQCVTGTLRRAGLSPKDVWAVSPSAPAGVAGDQEQQALDAVFGTAGAGAGSGSGSGPVRIPAPGPIGDTAAATATFQIAAVLTHAHHDPAAAGRIALITAVDRDGVLACALLRLR